mmetsp:Transcript_174/g.448  ORF Transcript_174/g.448 Transcript_174/m.448 type:complete len:262 (+) Transcript_174:553-1338(+)
MDLQIFGVGLRLGCNGTAWTHRHVIVLLTITSFAFPNAAVAVAIASLPLNTRILSSILKYPRSAQGQCCDDFLFTMCSHLVIVPGNVSRALSVQVCEARGHVCLRNAASRCHGLSESQKRRRPAGAALLHSCCAICLAAAAADIVIGICSAIFLHATTSTISTATYHLACLQPQPDVREDALLRIRKVGRRSRLRTKVIDFHLPRDLLLQLCQNRRCIGRRQHVLKVGDTALASILVVAALRNQVRALHSVAVMSWHAACS